MKRDTVLEINQRKVRISTLRSTIKAQYFPVNCNIHDMKEEGE